MSKNKLLDSSIIEDRQVRVIVSRLYRKALGDSKGHFTENSIRKDLSQHLRLHKLLNPKIFGTDKFFRYEHISYLEKHIIKKAKSKIKQLKSKQTIGGTNG